MIKIFASLKEYKCNYNKIILSILKKIGKAGTTKDV